MELSFCNCFLVPLAVLASYVVYSRLRKPREYRYLSSHVPSATKTLWAEMKLSWTVATTHPRDLLPFFMGLIRNHGTVVHFNLFGRAYVFLTDPDDLKVVLSSTQHIVKAPEYKMLEPWLHESLGLISGTKWQNRRKLLTNAFHIKTLHMYNNSMNKNAQILVEKLLEATEKDQAIDVAKYVALCSLDTICETIMGTELKAQQGKSAEYVDMIKSICQSLTDRFYKFWLWNDFIFGMSETGKRFYKAVKFSNDFTDNVIQNKKILLNNEKNQIALSENKQETPQKKSFLDILLSVSDEFPEQLTDKIIRGEVDTFLFAGHDTESIAVIMTLLLLGIYQDVQDKARAEINDIFGDSDRDATTEDINAMKYLEAVIKESLRIYPSVPGIMRSLQEPLHLKNYTIPPQTIISIYPYLIHRNEETFPKPEEFIPDRFLDDANKSKFNFGFVPFSAGPRNCIGQKFAMNQMKTVVSTILRKTKFETLGTRDDIHIHMEIVLGLESIPKMKFYKI